MVVWRVEISPHPPMTCALTVFRDIICGSQIDGNGVFGLYGINILIPVTLISLFKWIFSRDAVMIKQPRLVRQIAGCGMAMRQLNPLSFIKINRLKLQRGFNPAAGNRRA